MTNLKSTALTAGICILRSPKVLSFMVWSLQFALGRGHISLVWSLSPRMDSSVFLLCPVNLPHSQQFSARIRLHTAVAFFKMIDRSQNSILGILLGPPATWSLDAGFHMVTQIRMRREHDMKIKQCVDTVGSFLVVLCHQNTCPPSAVDTSFKEPGGSVCISSQPYISLSGVGSGFPSVCVPRTGCGSDYLFAMEDKSPGHQPINSLDFYLTTEEACALNHMSKYTRRFHANSISIYTT